MSVAQWVGSGRLAFVAVSTALGCGGCRACPAAVTTTPVAPAPKLVEGAPPSEALQTHERTLNEYVRGGDPRELGLYFATLMDTVRAMAELARSYPPAKDALLRRRTALGASIVSSPVKATARSLDLYIELGRQTAGQADMLSVLRTVTERNPDARDVRRRLVVELLPWMRTQGLHADVYANRDVLRDSLRFDAEMLNFQTKSGRLKGVALYEAALARGMIDEAKSFADQAQAVSPTAETISDLIDVAERAKVPGEVERLKERLRSLNPSGTDP